MHCYSTNNRNDIVSFREAVLRGLPPDNGLYMPTDIPSLPRGMISSLESMSFQEISFEVARNFIKNEIPKGRLEQLIMDVINFDAPLVNLDNNTYSLELFHGPTLAFKDFGARFMARIMSYFIENEDNERTILVATSGDTGSAVAQGFYNVDGIRVFLLYPSGKVSDIQEQQLTTNGGNITALEVKGTFDDCQKLVKQAFLDPDLATRFSLSSANSINLARLIPQSFYYFRAFAQIADKNLGSVFTVPSGNFGNLTAGLFAKKMGLPVSHFIASTNANKIVPEYLETGLFNPRPSVKTLSNAMDVGNPSNFYRIMDLYGGDLEKVRSDITGISITDKETLETIRRQYEETGYVLDPHGAVGLKAFQKWLKLSKQTVNGVFFETAHPAKFKDIVEEALETEIPLPEALAECMKKEKKADLIGSEFEEFREYLYNKA